MLGELRVFRKLAVFAVNGHEIAGTDQVQDQLKLFFAGVSRNVYGRPHGAVNQVRPAPRDVIHHAVNRLFVTGDDARTQHHGIAGLQVEMFVIIDGHAR